MSPVFWAFRIRRLREIIIVPYTAQERLGKLVHSMLNEMAVRLAFLEHPVYYSRQTAMPGVIHLLQHAITTVIAVNNPSPAVAEAVTFNNVGIPFPSRVLWL